MVACVFQFETNIVPIFVPFLRCRTLLRSSAAMWGEDHVN